jgi:small subunit ribosomal protein S6
MPALTEQRARKWAREYETIYILRPNVDPDEAERIAARIAEVVKRLDGKITKVDNWGKRRLAYTIQKLTRGIFVYVKYVGFGDLVAEIERNLRQFDAIMRFQTVLVREGVNPDSVNVDPEETKFVRIEVTADEDDQPSLEEQLALAAQAASAGGAEPPPEMEPEAAPEAEPEAGESRDEESN